MRNRPRATADMSACSTATACAAALVPLTTLARPAADAQGGPPAQVDHDRGQEHVRHEGFIEDEAEEGEED